MKIALLSLGVIASTLVAAGTSAESASTYYPLYCKGGNVSHDLVWPGGSVSTDVSFQRGTRAAGYNGAQLDSGTCAWFDRAMSPAEPSNIGWGSHHPSGLQSMVTLQFNGRTRATSYTSALQGALDSRVLVFFVQQAHTGARSYVGDKVAEVTDPDAKKPAPRLPEADPLANAYEGNVDRPGMDFWNNPTANPQDCRNECLRDTRCRAWTWVRPFNWSPTSGGAGTCRLKNGVPSQVANSSCVSGVR